MKALRATEAFVIHLTPLKYVKPRPTGKTFTFNLDELRNDMLSEARLKIF